MSLPSSYFDLLYEAEDDPWGFRSRPYEERKRAITVGSLLKERYGSVFEPGCSVGELTAPLAGRADRVLAMDPVATAVHQARARTVAMGNVEVVEGAIPGDWPDGRWDLVVLSEVGYYFDREALEEVASRALANTQELVAVHWRHRVDDYPLLGDDVHQILGSAATDAGLVPLVLHLEEDFRLDVWSRDDRSAARRGGLVG